MAMNSEFTSLAVWLHQTRIGLSLYDVAGQGYLKESVSSQNKKNYCKLEVNAKFGDSGENTCEETRHKKVHQKLDTVDKVRD